MKASIKKLAGGSEVVAGSLSGKKTLASLLELGSAALGAPELFFLDFKGIEIATASFLRESVLRYREIVRHRDSNIYPVVANLTAQVEEELGELLRTRKDVLFSCRLDEQARPSHPTLIGELEPKQSVTFDLVRERGETSASELMREYGSNEGVSQNAWNNRLATLASLGVVVEVTRGRSRRYRPLFDGV